MKKYFLLLLLSLNAFGNTKVVNIYNWSNYLPQKVIKEFEKKTGIKVNYSTFSSNEALFAKLKSNPSIGYDIIVPSSYYVDRMHQQGMLHKINKKALTNFKYLNKNLLNKSFDPRNEYSIPYLWGSTGIVINKKYYQSKHFNNWNTLWGAELKNQLLLLNDMRDIFSIALISLGYSPNDTNAGHIRLAYLKLKKLLPNVKLFNSDAMQSAYADEDVRIGMGWSSDTYQAQTQNSNIQFIYPKNGFVVWVDCLAIPKNAPHLENAYKFINFILQPKIAKQISVNVAYATPNTVAMKMLPAKMRNNLIINPPSSILKRGIFQKDVGSANEIYTRYWELLKLGVSSGA